MITKRLVIHGRVQGVGYRYTMVAAARRIGVTGWVRNRNDGTVEAIVQGDVSAVDSITEWAQRGPDSASVRQVEVFDEMGEEVYGGFTQYPTV